MENLKKIENNLRNYPFFIKGFFYFSDRSFIILSSSKQGGKPK